MPRLYVTFLLAAVGSSLLIAQEPKSQPKEGATPEQVKELGFDPYNPAQKTHGEAAVRLD